MAEEGQVSNDGRVFEGRIAQLMELRGVHALTREKQLSSKKVDLYFEEFPYGRRKKYAVECKDYGRPLTRSDIEEIYISHLGCIRDRDISDILIVSPKPLSASGQSYVDQIDELGFLTESDLRNSIIQFNGYLAGLKSKFSEDPVWNYHISSQGIFFDKATQFLRTPTKEFPSIESALSHQLEQGNGPFVVLGAYGIGKTTLAKRLFLELLARWERDHSAPIPIYLSLERMQQEQSLEGLLGTIFTSVSPAPGYNFDIFCALNERGHFTIILDGIDEMRHKLNKEEFLYNIDQLGILASANTKTILLGRPSAFMDEDEYNYVVHGRSVLGYSSTFSSGQKLVEVHLSMLSDSQVSTMIDKYCSWRHPKNPRYPERVWSVLSASTAPFIRDMIRRPIQLMMFLEIFPELPKPLDRVSKATVYSIFIDGLIARERTKQRSRKFSNSDHRRFARAIAWWLWQQGGGSRVEAKQVDANLFTPFVRGDDDLEEVRRTLVSASFLSTEGGTRLHFPHRSIQEFLVAEQIAESLTEGRSPLEEYPWIDGRQSDVFTVEVIEFLDVMIDAQQKWRLISDFDGGTEIPMALGAIFRGDSVYFETAMEQLRIGRSVSAAYLITDEVIRRGGGFNKGEGLVVRDILFHLIERTIDGYRAGTSSSARATFCEISAYLLCLLATASEDDAHVGGSGLLPTIARTMLRLGRVKKRKGFKSAIRNQRREDVIELMPQVGSFFRELEAGISTKGLSLNRLFTLIWTEASKGPNFKGWGSLNRPALPRGHFVLEISRYDSSYIRKLRELIAQFHEQVKRAQRN